MSIRAKKLIQSICIIFVVIGLIGCQTEPKTHPNVDRESKIPTNISKRSPETDHHPPILLSDEFEQPIPLDYPVNTAGLEDSAFILPDGNTLYFFFTPDAKKNPTEQLYDDVTGLWVTYKVEGKWTKPERVWLQRPGKLALDGAATIQGNEMWFASAREGYTGVNLFTAQWLDGAWKNWKYVGDVLMKEYETGEVHLQGDTLYFHSNREGGKGGYDIWVTTRSGDLWSEPINLEQINHEGDDAFPFISQDGQEFWFTRTYLGTPAIYRSINVDGEWSEPELIVSQFAGEPTLDAAGNLYFIHHYFENDVMIEADIYVAYRKQPNQNE